MIFKTTSGSHDKIIFSLFIASCVHVLVLFGLNITIPKNLNSQVTLDITLVTHKSTEEVKAADFLAAQDQAGSGTETKQKMLTQPDQLPEIPSLHQDSNQLPKLSKKQKQQKPDKKLLTSKNTPLKHPDTQSNLSENKINSDSPTESSQLIAKLEASLANKQQEYAKLPRIKRYTSVQAKKSIDAQYVYHWVKKIETLGTINYPEEARRYKIYGKLRLVVALNANGTINEVNIMESSGIKILDEAAVKIVYLAAPYAPFPQELKAEADIIEIIRTWYFTRDDFISTN